MGQRIAALRAGRGWTQQQLADRLGVSRVAVSHLETDINTPGERTVALLAGLFRVEPHDLVAGTSYPVAKRDRLPLVVARWTEVEHRLSLLERDLDWLARAAVADGAAVLAGWVTELEALEAAAVDPEERSAVADARRRVAELRLASPSLVLCQREALTKNQRIVG
ncbi:MAG: helix-turn-helix transcriptional regulator [Actinobacteria bacterium]|nr:helix-turn-helix transcriptional regulator [Actinomycetota bacterium]